MTYGEIFTIFVQLVVFFVAVEIVMTLHMHRRFSKELNAAIALKKMAELHNQYLSCVRQGKLSRHKNINMQVQHTVKVFEHLISINDLSCKSVKVTSKRSQDIDRDQWRKEILSCDTQVWNLLQLNMDILHLLNKTKRPLRHMIMEIKIFLHVIWLRLKTCIPNRNNKRPPKSERAIVASFELKEAICTNY